MNRKSARRIFFAIALLTLIVAVYSYMHRSELFRPDPCTCMQVYSGDSVLAMHAARRIVGNGYYAFTVQAGKEACASTYFITHRVNEGNLALDSINHSMFRAFFDSACKR